MKILKKGAEADVYISSWNGKKSVLKIRKEKKYRNSSLDTRIRKQRTIREAQIISHVKSFGISTPLIYFVNYKNFSIYMQFVKGKLIRDMDENSIPKICLQIGKIVGKLHQNGIMHGDLTTSNFSKASYIIYKMLADKYKEKFAETTFVHLKTSINEMSNYKDFYNTLFNSYDYKIGRTFLAPFRKIKTFI